MLLRSVTIIILELVFLCIAQNEIALEKTKLLQDIIHKVYNISSVSFMNASPNERKELLKNMEKRLRDSAVIFGDKADVYVHIIMHGFKALIANNTNHADLRKRGTFQSLVKPKHLNSTKINRKANKNIADKIADKILKVANKHINNAESTKEKIFIMENIRKKIMDVAAIQSSSKGEENKLYANLLTRSLEQMIKKLAQSKRRTEFISEIGNKIDRKNSNKLKPHVEFVVKKGKNLNVESTTLPDMGFASTPFKSCEATVKDTCEDIKALQRYQCSGNILRISKLCDGVVDCPNRADEQNCLHQVMSRMNSVNRIMSHLETYILEKCFLSSDNTVLIKQKEIFENVLHTQRTFLAQFSGLNTTQKLKEIKDIKETTNGVASILETLSIALNGGLCMYEIPDRTKMNARKQLGMFNDDVILRKEPLEQCNCDKSFCTDLSCPESCKLICWYKHSLARWSCHAVDETTSISLNKICDGKLDCYDESDETGCNTGATMNKFEANRIYEKVLKMIEMKTKSKEYSSVQNKLLLFYNSVKLLQKTTLTQNIQASSVRTVRDQCFTSLLSIYEDIIKNSTSVGDLDEAQLFLQSVNEKIVSALKRSHAGNDRISAPNDGCLCRRTQCIIPNCPKKCQNACTVRPRLTKYWCKGSSSNISIPLDWVCNNRQDCPYEDDEAQCTIEVCRKYHLIVLRESLRDTGNDKKGTSLGEALKMWRTKVISTLQAAEDLYRPTPTTFRDIIADILNDLVMTYASLEENKTYRRNKGVTDLGDFLKASQKIIEHLKLCNQ